jgi:hypothetical protein
MSTVSALYFFLATCVVAETAFKTDEAFARALPWLSNLTQKIRGRLRTTARAEFAPMLRDALSAIVMLTLIPPFAALALYLAGSVKDAYRVSLLFNTSMIMTTTFTGFYLLSTPTGSQTGEIVFYLVTNGCNWVVSFVTECLLNSRSGLELDSQASESFSLIIAHRIMLVSARSNRA